MNNSGSILKAYESDLKKIIIIMNKNDPFSKLNEILLGHNSPNGVVNSKSSFKVEICNALWIFDSHPMLHSLSLILSLSKILISILIAIIVEERT